MTQPPDFDYQLSELEKELRFRLTEAFEGKWKNVMRQALGSKGVSEEQIAQLADYFLDQLVNFSAVVTMESLPKRAFKTGLVVEIRGKIMDAVESAIARLQESSVETASAQDADLEED